MSLFLIGSIAAGIFFLVILIAISFRVVVPTNAVHIVQSAKRSTPYGKDMGGNTYYKWPAWLPIRIGANEASNTTFAHRQLAQRDSILRTAFPNSSVIRRAQSWQRRHWDTAFF